MQAVLVKNTNFTSSPILSADHLQGPKCTVTRNTSIKMPPVIGRLGFDPWVGKIAWRRTWQPTPGLLPGESPWTDETGRQQSIASRRVRHD